MMNRRIILSITLFFLFHCHYSWSADTDFYLQTPQPNIIMIYDLAKEAELKVGYGGSITNLASIALVEGQSFVTSSTGINVGLMTQNPLGGGYVGHEPRSLSTLSGKLAILNQLRAWKTTGAPYATIMETLFEAFLYLKGSQKLWGTAGVATYDTLSGVYISPIKHQCQSNNLVYLMSGRPGIANDNDSDFSIRSLTGALCGLPTGGNTLTGPYIGSCFDELSTYMYKNDLSGSLPGVQNASVHVISLSDGMEHELKAAASNSGGLYFKGNQPGFVQNALQQIAQKALDQSSLGNATIFTQPGTSISAENRLRNAEDVYYPVFQPTNGPGWRGNLKRYSLRDDNQLYDANGLLAIDSSSGFFNSSAKSYWSSGIDGDVVTQGGMAEKLTSTRPVFTYLGGNKQLNLSGNRLHESNSAINPMDLHVSNKTDAKKVLQWARGVDVDDADGDSDTTDDRNSIGDPLHTQPKVITYFKDTSRGASIVDKMVYFTTNDGFLHGVDTQDGTTEFSFIPQELLKNLVYYKDKPIRFRSGFRPDTQLLTTKWTFDKAGASIAGNELLFTSSYITSANQKVYLHAQGVYEFTFNVLGPLGGKAQMAYAIFDPTGKSIGAGSIDNLQGVGVNKTFVFEAKQSGQYTVRFTDQTPFAGAFYYWRLYNYALIAPAARNQHMTQPYRLYGMDGPMNVWVNDVNGDGDIMVSKGGSIDPGEHAYLYLTMRRGGRSIYALDVTSRKNPVFKWQIKGGAGSFTRLGYTWSGAKPVNVRWNSSSKKVVLFGGGYDDAVDSHTTIQNSRFGNAVYMVDAETGNLLWWASNNSANLNMPAMTHGIAADLTPLDLTGDGLIDVIYAVDVGGQIFRIDINDKNTSRNNFARGGLIAGLSSRGSSEARRFFHPVTVAYGGHRDKLMLSVGSGNRSQMLSAEVQDRIYMIRDENIGKPVSYNYVSGRVITERDLYDATENLTQQGSVAQQRIAGKELKNKSGWFIRLIDSGEKVLSKPVVYNNILLVNTFKPHTHTNACHTQSGLNYSYALNLNNGGAYFNLDGKSGYTKSNRRQALKHTTIAPSASIFNSGPKGVELCIGTECFTDLLRSVVTEPVRKSFWRENR